MFDADGNGTLDLDEIQKVLSDLGRPMSAEDIKNLLFDVDVGHQGVVDRNDFIQMMAGKNKFRTCDLTEEQREKVKMIFQTFDQDSDGFWTYEDFQRYFTAIESTHLEMSEEAYLKVNGMLGKEEKIELMGLNELLKFYTIQDRTHESDLESDYEK